jgi:hypothetical protein
VLLLDVVLIEEKKRGRGKKFGWSLFLAWTRMVQSEDPFGYARSPCPWHMPFHNLIVKILKPNHDIVELLESRRICSFQIGQLQIATLSMTGGFRAEMATSGPMFVVPAAGKVPERLSLILIKQCQSPCTM